MGIFDKLNRTDVPLETTETTSPVEVDKNSTLKGSINNIKAEAQRIRTRLENIELELDVINAQIGE